MESSIVFLSEPLLEMIF